MKITKVGALLVIFVSLQAQAAAPDCESFNQTDRRGHQELNDATVPEVIQYHRQMAAPVVDRRDQDTADLCLDMLRKPDRSH